MDFPTQLGLDPATGHSCLDHPALAEYANLKLMALGQPTVGADEASRLFRMGRSLIANYQEKTRLLADYLPPVDQRAQDFLARYFGDLPPGEIPRLPNTTFVLDRHGLARNLSLPAKQDRFASDIVDSYRIHQGVLHNPAHDRRTTKGVFHVGEGGLPVPNDKKAVPKIAAARLFSRALAPPEELMRLPFHAGEEHAAPLWTSLLLRPVAVPGVPGFTEEKSLEVRFFAPGNLVSNLDFVESIFGNAGDPTLAHNDAALDPEHWTGHTGCILLAPHMMGMTKRELGLPRADEATERQKRDGMCWEREDEIYNDGSPFKITCRDASGVVVTAIADNYFGYCKKEVKTQISFSANLHGVSEEEHAGGALVFPSYDLGEDFALSQQFPRDEHAFDDTVRRLDDLIEMQPEGYAVDKTYPDIHYVPEDTRIDLDSQSVAWTQGGEERRIKLLPDRTYVYPSGYKVEMVQPAEGRRWRLSGAVSEAAVCHKPCTVSGGGKSEISKPITDAIITGPVFVSDFQKDFDMVERIVDAEFGQRFKDPAQNRERGRPLLSKERSLGSVIKLLTPSETEYHDAYNEWLRSIPQHVKDLVLIIKRYYKDDWGGRWRDRFSVDLIDGVPGNELRYRGQRMMTQYLRVGYTSDGSWRTFGLRKDFLPANKISLEDDISATAVAPAERLSNLPESVRARSVKFVHNCEYRFFQRPDDAIVRGYDKQAERDLSSRDSFLSNYQPHDREFARNEIEDAIRFGQYTGPMQRMVHEFVRADGPAYYTTNAYPRLIDGKPSKNPRYLQVRPDLTKPRATYLADVSTRLYRRLNSGDPLYRPVTAVLPGHRNNPPDPAAGVGALCVMNPIHCFGLPELFMDYIASITGRSPSTTGAGSEGALTKAPFNALPPIYDLNNALVAYLATEKPVFITAAGHIGPNYRVDHDISLLAPEIWSRLKESETDPAFLIEDGHLEKLEDFEHDGRTVRASRLGHRITRRFARIFLGRVFNNPASVFTEEMLKPELQDMETFVSGVDTIVAAHREVALNYFEDGSIEQACPPLKALLHIMAEGDDAGDGIDSPRVRNLFTRDNMLQSEWYWERLESQQRHDARLWRSHIAALENFMGMPGREDEVERLGLRERLETARRRLAEAEKESYPETLAGGLGRQPID